MRRREFIALVGGAVTWPFAAIAQQTGRIQRVGVLMGYADDPEPKSWIAALERGLKELGWKDGENIRIEYRWAAGDGHRIKTMATELVGLKPHVLVAGSSPALSALVEETRSVSIVFLNIYDPLGQGFVASLAHPGGNATGFSSFEDSIPGKTLELLKEFAPRVERVAVVFNPATAPYAPAQLRLIEVAAPSFGLWVIATPVEDAADIERAVAQVASTPNSSLFVMSSAFISMHRQLIIELAARYRLPATYSFRYYAKEGGLLSYSPSVREQYRAAASYVDRVLKGASAADLPVQQPTKLELVINLKTAKALGMTIPPTLLARADEVIE